MINIETFLSWLIYISLVKSNLTKFESDSGSDPVGHVNVLKKARIEPFLWIPEFQKEACGWYLFSIRDNKEGCYFIYKIGMNGENNLFCSNDCSFDYCLKTNSISIVKSNIEKGYSLAISPHLQEINKALGSVYKFKPVKYQTFGKN